MSNTPWTDAAERLLVGRASAIVRDGKMIHYAETVENLRRIEREHAQMLDVLRRIRIALADVLPEDNAQDKRQDGGVPYFQFD